MPLLDFRINRSPNTLVVACWRRLFSSTTSFAQSSDLSLSPDVKETYIADSESSSIRTLNLTTGGSRLLAGGYPVFSDNLFKMRYSLNFSTELMVLVVTVGLFNRTYFGGADGGGGRKKGNPGGGRKGIQVEC
ncbi:hypothetical protein L1887_24539 [Cichorium endivia]|nr:hypothetical protein L1887_24539 [Cichorium endivia]